MGILETILEKGITSTCSLLNPVDSAITFCAKDTSRELLYHIRGIRLTVITKPGYIDEEKVSPLISLIEDDNPRLLFCNIHNMISRSLPKKENEISKAAKIHPTACIGASGSGYEKAEQGWMAFYHAGNVVIEDDVSIGPFSVVHRGVIDSTIIKCGTKIGSHCTIGHNCIINEHCLLTARVSIAGSCYIDKNCYFGVGSVIKNGISICKDVVIGAGAVVVKDIELPGIYVGVPASILEKRK